MICQRCAKNVPDIHTCTPSALVRELEAQVTTMRAQRNQALAEHERTMMELAASQAEIAALKAATVRPNPADFGAWSQESLAKFAQEVWEENLRLRSVNRGYVGLDAAPLKIELQRVE